MQKRKVGLLILVSALIWAAIIISCSVVLKNTDCYGKIQNLLVTGVVCHLLFVWIPFATFFRNKITQ